MLMFRDRNENGQMDIQVPEHDIKNKQDIVAEGCDFSCVCCMLLLFSIITFGSGLVILGPHSQIIFTHILHTKE